MRNAVHPPIVYLDVQVKGIRMAETVVEVNLRGLGQKITKPVPDGGLRLRVLIREQLVKDQHIRAFDHSPPVSGAFLIVGCQIVPTNHGGHVKQNL